MDEIIRMLENWKLLPIQNNIVEKDYLVDERRQLVFLMIGISIERPFLFKTFTAVCQMNIIEIENAINQLEERKDLLI